MSFSNIPVEMQLFPQWICWRLEWQEGDVKRELKPTKIPYKPNGNFADVTNSKTWSTFDLVVASRTNSKEPVDFGTPISQTGFSGIGFVFTKDDPFAGIDLDNPHGDQILIDRQMKIFQVMDSYSERSPSGQGLHIIVKAKVAKGRRRPSIELYSQERYFTMTGDVFKNAPIAERQREIEILWNEMGGNNSAPVHDGNAPQTDEDAAIIERARGAINGPKFSALYDGNYRDYYGPEFGDDGTGHSEADFALIDIIAFYTQNREQIRRIFLSSNLGKREKAQRVKYVDDMIGRSFDKLLPPIHIDGVEGAAQQLELKIEENKWKNPATELPKQEILLPEQQLMLPGFPSEFAKSNHLDKLPPGIMGEIANFVYQSSPTPVREIALAAAIGLMAGITGRAYNISGAGLNQYVLVLAPTGSGKEAVSTGISHLMTAVKNSGVAAAADFIGPGNIRSDAALLKWLVKNPCFVSIVGEFGLRLKQLSSQHASPHEIGLRGVILDLYNKSGAGKVINPMAYSDKDKNTAIVVAPAFTLLGESTPETFYNALDESMITEGLLPRFTILEYEGFQPPLNKGHELVKPDYNLIDELGKLCASCLSLSHDNKVVNVTTSDEAQILFDEIREFARGQTNSAERDIVRQLWSRVNIKVMKLAALVAVGVNPFNPIITLEQANWAKSLIIADVMNMLRRFNRGDIGKDTEELKQDRIIKKYCLDYVHKRFEEIQGYLQGEHALALHTGRIIPAVYLNRRCSALAAFRNDPRGATFSIKRAIQNLVDADVLREVSPKDLAKFNTRQKGYMIADYDQLLEL